MRHDETIPEEVEDAREARLPRACEARTNLLKDDSGAEAVGADAHEEALV